MLVRIRFLWHSGHTPHTLLFLYLTAPLSLYLFACFTVSHLLCVFITAQSALPISLFGACCLFLFVWLSVTLLLCLYCQSSRLTALALACLLWSDPLGTCQQVQLATAAFGDTEHRQWAQVQDGGLQTQYEQEGAGRCHRCRQMRKQRH